MESRNGYSLSIIGGQTQPDGYTAMSHGQNYKVKLVNHHPERCQATLKIDGGHMGNFLLNPYDNVIIERPVQSRRQFQFVLVNTREATLGGVQSGDYFNGLVEVSFIPEKKGHCPCRHYLPDENLLIDLDDTKETSMGLCGYQEGGTVLKDPSNQDFENVSPLDLDFTRETHLSLRLVGKSPVATLPVVEPLPHRPIVTQPTCPYPHYPQYPYPEPEYPFSLRIPPPPPVGRRVDPWFRRSNYHYNVYNPRGSNTGSNPMEDHNL